MNFLVLWLSFVSVWAGTVKVIIYTLYGTWSPLCTVYHLALLCKSCWKTKAKTKSSSSDSVNSLISSSVTALILLRVQYLTVIAGAQMSSESLAHEAEGWKDYWLRGHEGKKKNFFSKIQTVGLKNIRTKHLALDKARLKSFFASKTLQVWPVHFTTSGL